MNRTQDCASESDSILLNYQFKSIYEEKWTMNDIVGKSKGDNKKWNYQNSI